MIRPLLGLAAALLLSGCGTPEQDTPAPTPLLYEIASADGEVEGWLFGTIHALPDGVEWRTPAIEQAIAEAETLVVEIAGFDDPQAFAALFAARASAAGDAPPVLDRVPAPLRTDLSALVEQSNKDPDKLQALDTWAVALLLAPAMTDGDSANGVDRALVSDFAGRRVIELEGVARQLEMFDTLPEREQRDMLVALVTDSVRWKDDRGHLTRAWLEGDLEQVIEPANGALLADPELREVLLTRRNAEWADQVSALLASEPATLVAVGAAHLPGPDGLAARLEQFGYTVRPIR